MAAVDRRAMILQQLLQGKKKKKSPALAAYPQQQVPVMVRGKRA